MASLATSESWACINRDDEFEGIEVSGLNGAFLMSLMEELQDHVEESDEERLNSVIQSLEAEINSRTTMDTEQVSSMESDHSDGEDSQSCSLGEILDSHDCSISFDDVDMNEWINIEAEPCSPSHEMNCYMYHFGDEMSNGVIGFGGALSTDDSARTYYGVALDQEEGYNSLWQETIYDSLM